MVTVITEYLSFIIKAVADTRLKCTIHGLDS
jgi:hypothetical protein